MKINIGVVFGGRSVEHEISIISAVGAMGYIDSNKYKIIPIYIDKNNDWYTGMHLKDILSYRDMALLKRYATKVSLVKINNGFALQTRGLIKRQKYPIDIILPVGHGTYMEDGSLQGYLNMLGIPFVGSNVLASAVGQDKVIMKQLLKASDIPMSKFIWFYKNEFENNKKKILEELKNFKYPLYIKPANLGSSIGISKVNDENQLITGIKEAIKYDNKILVEEAIKNVKEVNISVLGNIEKQEVSAVEEINSSSDFYSFKEKYVENYSKTVTSARKTKPILSKEMLDDLKTYAIKTFKAINASGVARIDFLINEKEQKIYINEINTIPGDLASYLWLPKKKKQAELIDDLLKLAIDEYKSKKEIVYALPGNLLEQYDTLSGEKLNKNKK